MSNPPPSLSLYVYRATVVEVENGRVFRANVSLGFKTWRIEEVFYLADIERGDIERLREVINGKSVIIQTLEDRKENDRFLAKVWVQDDKGESVYVNGLFQEGAKS